MKHDSFYEKLVPQSSYRSFNKETETKSQHYINLTLPKLKKLNDKEKIALQNLIAKKRSEIMQILLPEKLIKTAENDGYLAHLFKELGIK